MCLITITLISGSYFSFTAMAYRKSTFRAFVGESKLLLPLDKFL